MGKQSLRNQMTNKLLEMDEETTADLNKKMVTQLFQSELWQAAKTVGTTISQGTEWDTEPIIRQGWKEAKRIVVPKCLPISKELIFYQLESYSQLEVVYYQLREPNPNQARKVDKAEIDLLIVPGLVFDHMGYRIGFGGGYYDRFLADFPNQTTAILYSGQLVKEVPKEAFDIPVQTLITEDGLLPSKGEKA